jgi:hypothetical protein
LSIAAVAAVCLTISFFLQSRLLTLFLPLSTDATIYYHRSNPNPKTALAIAIHIAQISLQIMSGCIQEKLISSKFSIMPPDNQSSKVEEASHNQRPAK